MYVSFEPHIYSGARLAVVGPHIQPPSEIIHRPRHQGPLQCKATDIYIKVARYMVRSLVFVSKITHACIYACDVSCVTQHMQKDRPAHHERRILDRAREEFHFYFIFLLLLFVLKSMHAVRIDIG